MSPRQAGRELNDHHGRRQQLEPAVTHRVSPGQPREETESCIELEIGVPVAVAQVHHLDAYPLVRWITGTSSRAWRGGRTARQQDQPIFPLLLDLRSSVVLQICAESAACNEPSSSDASSSGLNIPRSWLNKSSRSNFFPPSASTRAYSIRFVINHRFAKFFR